MIIILKITKIMRFVVYLFFVAMHNIIKYNHLDINIIK